MRKKIINKIYTDFLKKILESTLLTSGNKNDREIMKHKRERIQSTHYTIISWRKQQLRTISICIFH